MTFLDRIPPVTKNLLFLNLIVFALQHAIPGFDDRMALHFFQSPSFQPYQVVVHMFMHSMQDMRHLLFNMFGLYMFGMAIEQRIGPKKYLIYYLLTGLGAVILHASVQYFENYDRLQELALYMEDSRLTKTEVTNFYYNVFGTMRGASGAIFGLLAAFALLFPNEKLQLLFIPFPIRAKYFVLMYGAYELIAGMSDFEGDNIAHFAHLGGALFGFLIITYWRKTTLL